MKLEIWRKYFYQKLSLYQILKVVLMSLFYFVHHSGDWRD
jgi:hypothetical protein